jgi:hypothetical protein
MVFDKMASDKITNTITATISMIFGDILSIGLELRFEAILPFRKLAEQLLDKVFHCYYADRPFPS